MRKAVILSTIFSKILTTFLDEQATCILQVCTEYNWDLRTTTTTLKEYIFDFHICIKILRKSSLTMFSINILNSFIFQIMYVENRLDPKNILEFFFEKIEATRIYSNKKNDSILSRNKSVLNLPHFLTHCTVEKKARKFQNWFFFFSQNGVVVKLF